MRTTAESLVFQIGSSWGAIAGIKIFLRQAGSQNFLPAARILFEYLPALVGLIFGGQSVCDLAVSAQQLSVDVIRKIAGNIKPYKPDQKGHDQKRC